ncbi:BT1A1 protein, partial [Crypturellus soui]|nr:BT1A1 protein [Crypturellus soui]
VFRLLSPAPFQVMAPARAVAAALGQATVLPCRLAPEQSAQAMEVTWFRGHFSPFVHRYKEGAEQHAEQLPQYQGRTELLRDGLDRGHVDLRILRVRLDDEGNYTCLVRDPVGYEEAVVELRVTAAGSAPLISVERYEAGGVRVSCWGSGWYPRPRVQWMDKRGRPLPPAAEDVARDQDGLFEAGSAVVLRAAARQPLTCSIRDALQHHEKRSALVLADPFFQNVHPWKIAVSLVSVAAVALSVATFFLFKIKASSFWFLMDLVDPAVGSSCRYLLPPPFAAQVSNILDSFSPAVNVILDPDTAHCDLVLSEDGRSVERRDVPQELPDIPERFLPWRCVLGCDGFVSGRHCWEVEVEDGGGWTAGVARGDVRRKGDIEFKPDEGIWAVGKWAGRFQAMTSPQRTFFPGISSPKRIRVALDCEEGRVAFFSVDEKTPVFAFPLESSNGVKIYPWVWLGPGTRLRMRP